MFHSTCISTVSILLSFPLHLYLDFVCAFTKVNFVVASFFSPSEEQTSEAETVAPQPGLWHASSEEDVPECKIQ